MPKPGRALYESDKAYARRHGMKFPLKAERASPGAFFANAIHLVDARGNSVALFNDLPGEDTKAAAHARARRVAAILNCLHWFRLI